MVDEKEDFSRRSFLTEISLKLSLLTRDFSDRHCALMLQRIVLTFSRVDRIVGLVQNMMYEDLVYEVYDSL